ncbi:long-chain fatty acid--CoA ligase [uncultured Gulosibacter sp.]|uniref:AMP-dependent synthetase/ligase n=1 Tax=uncultured Gulosibacter sp. TaxID=1339167 RepID=UPI00288A7B12|nr:long-chain fatty acid--CoA ligase [uncultured Gulosibacter sp.]
MTDNAVVQHQREFHTPALVPHDPASSTYSLLLERVALTPETPLFSVPEGEGWRDISARQFLDEVHEIARGLIGSGIRPGERIAFIGTTSYQWSLIDYALWAAGAVMVPIYETDSPERINWIIDHSEAIAVIAQLPEHAEKITAHEAPLPERVRKLWQLHNGGMHELRQAGEGVTDEQVRSAGLSRTAADEATLIYTSGSTGKPKAVILTHSNFVDLSKNSAEALSVMIDKPGASTLLFITLAHVFARFISVMCVSNGVKVGHQSDTKRLVPALASFRPTFLLAVPRVFEKVYNSAAQKAAAGGKRGIFKRAVRVGVAYSKALDTGRVPFGLRLQYRLFDKLVFSKLRDTLGGRVEHAVSGSAPLGLFLGHFYRALGVQVLEGYGLTETTAPISVNLPDSFKIGTVGPPLPGCAVRIDADGEILTRGINVFREYWRNPEANATAFTEDGWFCTGDIGQLDADGYLSVTGRKKDLIITAGGKNVAPAVLEDPIRADVLVGECVVVGDAQPFVSAIITLDHEMLSSWLEVNGLETEMSLAEASRHPRVREHVQEVIDRANRQVSRAESIRKFEILDHVFSIDEGTMTAKLSIRRHVVLEQYADVIDRIYEGVERAQEPHSASKH